MLKLITESQEERQGFISALDEIAREGARKMLTEALQIEVADYVQNFTPPDPPVGKC